MWANLKVINRYVYLINIPNISISLSFSANYQGYQSAGDPLPQQRQRQLPALPQTNTGVEHQNEASYRNTLSVNDHVDQHGYFQQETSERRVSTSGRTTPTILLDPAATSDSAAQSRLVPKHC